MLADTKVVLSSLPVAPTGCRYPFQIKVSRVVAFCRTQLVDVFRGFDYLAEKVRLIVNRHEERGDIGIEQVERTPCTPVTRAIPNHYAAAASVNQGAPIIALDRGNPISRALMQKGAEFRGAALRRTARWRW